MLRHSPAAGPSTAPPARGARSWLRPNVVQPLDPYGETHRRNRCDGAETCEQLVVAPTGDELAVDAKLRVVQLEHEARVVIEPTPERGGELDARNLDALRGEESRAALEQVERS